MKKLNVSEKNRVSLNMSSELLANVDIITFAKNVYMLEEANRRKKTIDTSQCEIEFKTGNRSETITDMLENVIESDSIIYSINRKKISASMLFEKGMDVMSKYIKDKSLIDNIDLITLNNEDIIEELYNEGEDNLLEYIDDQGIDMIFQENVDDFLAFNGWEIIEETIDKIKKEVPKLKSEIEAFEKLSGYDRFENLLYNQTKKYIETMDTKEAIYVIEQKLHM